MSRAIVILLASLLTVTVIISLFICTENLYLQSQVSNLKQEIIVLQSANLTTALGIVEIPPYGESYWGGNGNSSYLWITGWVFNYGSAMAKKAGLDVLAFDESNDVLMNHTVPITSGGIAAFSTNPSKNLIPDYLYSASLEFGNILSQENVTIRMAIFHEGTFSNSTRYEINPIWENIQYPIASK
jgi:hypothetical protein